MSVKICWISDWQQNCMVAWLEFNVALPVQTWLYQRWAKSCQNPITFWFGLEVRHIPRHHSHSPACIHNYLSCGKCKCKYIAWTTVVVLVSMSESQDGLETCWHLVLVLSRAIVECLNLVSVSDLNVPLSSRSHQKCLDFSVSSVEVSSRCPLIITHWNGATRGHVLPLTMCP